MVCDCTNNIKDTCEIYLKKYNQKVLGSVFFFQVIFSCSEQGYSSILTCKKRRGGGGKLAWSIGETKTKTSQPLQGAHVRSYLQNCWSYLWKDIFLTHLCCKGKISSTKQTFFKIEAFQMRGTCDKGCFQALFFT